MLPKHEFKLHVTTAWVGTETESLFHPLQSGLLRLPEEHKGIANNVALYTKDMQQNSDLELPDIFKDIMLAFFHEHQIQWNGIGFIRVIGNY